MSNRSELLRDARAYADQLGKTTTEVVCRSKIRDLADVVEAYDKADSELATACKTCEEAIGSLINSARPASVDGSLDADLPIKWDRLRAARKLAQVAVENHEKAKGGR